MKNSTLLLTIFSTVLFFIFTSSFTEGDGSSEDQFGYFYVNPDGSRGEQVLGEHTCQEETTAICCQEYNITTGQPTGDPAKMHFGTRL